ncbi:MAG TPA: FAD-linked oxidase C-terminal domain-containing protein [Polyangiaceae bacterium]|nr:FAD-linked oxidase C-terminal domain-containing protein [Polyangiaceae bacterium]
MAVEVLLELPDVALPSEAALTRAKVALGARLGDSKVDTSRDGCERFMRDDSDATGRLPSAVVHAANTDDVRACLAIAQDLGVPVTPRAAGTGRTGGAVPVAGGIVLATSALADTKEIDRDDLVAVVGPGVVTGELHAACEAEGLFYPPDPSSWQTCMIGGNVAENAGGPRAFKYGVTRDYVLGVEACLMGGEVLRPGRRTVKGVTGYDVTSLLVGSEGTLAVFSEVTLRLVRRPPAVHTLLALFDDVTAAARAVSGLVRVGHVPRCLELMDRETLVALRASGAAIDPRAGALLLCEVDGHPAAAEEAFERVGEQLSASPGILEVQVAQDEASRDRLWAARRALSGATRKLAKYKLSEDVVVPRSRLEELLVATRELAAEHGVRHLTYGHAGDGNMHVNFLWDAPEERPAVARAIEALMRTTVALGGTLSGEHGIGIAKAPYLALEQSPGLIRLQRDLKSVFDPRGLLNPGKIFPAPGHRAC